MTRPTWRLRTRTLDLARGALMGVLNITPDSFSDGGVHQDPEMATRRGLEMVAEGAAIVDVGGESTRPGASPVSYEVESKRVLPVVRALAGEGVVVSIDTSKPEVAEAALENGAEIVNDVTALAAPGMAELVAEVGCGVVLMHMKGTPRHMQADPRYDDVVAEVRDFLAARIDHAAELGLDRSRMVVDPGIGFGKTVEHNLELIRHLETLVGLAPVLLGASRKTFLGKISGIEDPVQRDLLSAVTTTVGFINGARVFRVHDVPSSHQALALGVAIVAGY